MRLWFLSVNVFVSLLFPVGAWLFALFVTAPLGVVTSIASQFSGILPSLVGGVGMLPGGLALVSKATDVFAAVIIITSTAFKVATRTITAFGLYFPVRQLITTLSGIYGMIIITVIISGIILEPVWLEVQDPIQFRGNEAYCYIVTLWKYIIYLLSLPADVYNAIIPYVNFILAIVYAYIKMVIEQFLLIFFVAIGILIRLIFTPESAACVGTHDTCLNYQNATEFPCTTEQVKCLGIAAVAFGIDTLVGGAMASLPSVGPIVSVTVVNFAWFAVDYSTFALQFFGGMVDAQGCVYSNTCDVCSLRYDGPQVPPCCTQATVTCLLTRFFAFANVIEVLTQLLEQLPLIGPLIKFVASLFSKIADFINQTFIVPANGLLQQILGPLYSIFNDITTFLCGLAHDLLLPNLGPLPQCGWGVSLGSDGPLPLIPDSVASAFEFAPGVRRMLSVSGAASASASPIGADSIFTPRAVRDQLCSQGLRGLDPRNPCTRIIRNVCSPPALRYEELAPTITILSCLAASNMGAVWTDYTEPKTRAPSQARYSHGRAAAQLHTRAQFQGGEFIATFPAVTHAKLHHQKAPPMRLLRSLTAHASGYFAPSSIEIMTAVRDTIFPLHQSHYQAEAEAANAAHTASERQQAQHQHNQQTQQQKQPQRNTSATHDSVRGTPTNKHTRHNERTLLQAGCTSQGCAIDSRRHLVFAVDDAIARTILNSMIRFIWSIINLFMSIFTSGVPTATFTFLTDFDLSQFAINLDNAWISILNKRLIILQEALKLLEMLMDVLFDLRIVSPAGLVSFIYNEVLECTSTTSYNGKTNLEGEWRLFCAFMLQFPPTFPNVPELSDHIDWGIPCLQEYTCDGGLDTHIAIDGVCIPCICPYGEYMSCKTIYESGMHLISGLLSGALEYVSQYAVGITGDGELVFGMRDIINLHISIDIRESALPVIQTKIYFVNLLPPLRQFLEMGLDANGHSISRNVFPGGSLVNNPGDPDSGKQVTISLSAFCAFIRLPGVLKDAVIIVVWAVVLLGLYATGFVFAFAIISNYAPVLFYFPFIFAYVLWNAFMLAERTPPNRDLITQADVAAVEAMAIEDGIPPSALVHGMQTGGNMRKQRAHLRHAQDSRQQPKQYMLQGGRDILATVRDEWGAGWGEEGEGEAAWGTDSVSGSDEWGYGYSSVEESGSDSGSGGDKDRDMGQEFDILRQATTRPADSAWIPQRRVRAATRKPPPDTILAADRERPQRTWRTAFGLARTDTGMDIRNVVEDGDWSLLLWRPCFPNWIRPDIVQTLV